MSPGSFYQSKVPPLFHSTIYARRTLLLGRLCPSASMASGRRRRRIRCTRVTLRLHLHGALSGSSCLRHCRWMISLDLFPGRDPRALPRDGTRAGSVLGLAWPNYDSVDLLFGKSIKRTHALVVPVPRATETTLFFKLRHILFKSNDSYILN